MKNNMLQWGSRKVTEIQSDDKVNDKAEEKRKLEERLQKFKDKMGYLDEMVKLCELKQKK